MKRMVETKAVELIESIAAKNVTPEMVLNPKIEDFVDADGNKRFQDVEISYYTESFGNAFKGLAAINGKELIIAGAIDMPSLTASINSSVNFADIDVPGWVYDLIQTWGAENRFVRFCSVANNALAFVPLIAVYKSTTRGKLNLRNLSPNALEQTAGKSISFSISLIL